jgi:phosphatidate cytidylyltransferase
MPHPDPDSDDRPEVGYPGGGADPPYPRRRAPRHFRRAVADEPAVATTDLWPAHDEPARTGGDVWSPTGGDAWSAGGGDAWSAGGGDAWETGSRGDGWDGWDGPNRLRPAYPDTAYPDAAYPDTGADLTEQLPAVVDDDPVDDDGRPGEPGARGGPRPGEPDPAGPDAGLSQSRRSRAGRNLPAAIGVGVGLGAAVLASLFLWRPAFVAVAALAVGVGIWEMVRAVRLGGLRAPLAPLLVGGVATVGLAWFGGPEVLALGLLVTVLAVLVWRLADGVAGYQRDVTAAIMIATYVPFLASFAVLLVRPEDGALRVLVALIGVVLSDTGGYASGVFLGRHPMAPRVSPKKSWEGFAGSVVCTAAGEAVLLHVLFDAAWWQGAVFGVAVSVAAVLGDLAESLIKRDLKVKDMSSLLPGHGGLMDRLDSILLAAPVAYAVLSLVAPAVS